ncbi:MAG TPA: RagB/SusD family nutrient uptake outer membrane protein [Cyclobacteriaceae bacterium]|nr:RagB/SusD family nutrient uptake outer membrane protein [Cyclobacteriaceae bacterium]HRK53335.1 RagB/SusD family nutrient uptake outer membrane protein [Cyclobacteriaceae bacterium]
MKKTIYKYSLVVLVTLVFSCNTLDQEPRSQISTDAAFADPNSAQGAVNGMYNILQGVYEWRVQVLSDISADVSQQIDTWDALIAVDEFGLTPDNSEVEDLYSILFRLIDISNAIITNVDKVPGLSDALKNDFKGQAYGVRGIAYFELARFWGGVPGVYGTDGVAIRTTPSIGIDASSYASRASLIDTYDQARTDLETGLSLLPDSRSGVDLRGRLVKATTRAMLARVHLYLKDYNLAAQYATDVISDANYTLVKPYSDIFNKRNTAESVLEVQFNLTDRSGMRNWYYPAALGARGGVALHEAFYNQISADPLDVRYKMTAARTTTSGKTVYYPTKWPVANDNNNTQVIRIAEMYLIRAEARILGPTVDIAGAQSDIDLIRDRAGLGATTAATVNDLMDEIMDQRKKEFFAEGHRWFDLIRTGRALSVLTNLSRSEGSATYSLSDPDRQVFPFPNKDVQTNPNLKQNEAYN